MDVAFNTQYSQYNNDDINAHVTRFRYITAVSSVMIGVMTK